MTSNWTYVVTHIDDDTGVSTDITTYVKSIPVFSDVGSGQVNHATLVLNALNGRFLIDSVSTQPFLSQFDKITIRVTDINSSQYAKVFEIKSIIPTIDKGSGTIVTVELIGIEHHTQQINFSGTKRFVSGFTTSRDICDTYNENKGSKQPTLVGYSSVLNPTTKLGNGFPTYTVNTYPFGDGEDSCYNRLVDMLDKFGASVDAGGIRDFLELNFITDPTTPTQIGLSVFASGSYPESIGGTPKLVDGSTANINTGDTEGGIDTVTATRSIGWGDLKKGSLPTDFSDFEAEDEAWLFRPAWVAGISYAVNAIVAYGTDPKTQYKCITAHTSTSGNKPPSAFWTAVTRATVYGNTITYSPWTRQKAAFWANCGSDVYNTGPGHGFFDSNLVIWTDDFFRTWVIEKVNSASIRDDKYQYETLEYPIGHRLLVTTIPSWMNATDIYGISYTNSVVEYQQYTIGTVTGRDWIVKYKLDGTKIGMQVAEIKTGKVWQWNGAAFTDLSGAIWGNDCFHPFASIANVAGVDGRPASEGWTNNTLSAIKVTYTFPNIDTAAWTTSGYKVGAWLSLAFPFPLNKNTLGTNYVGSVYGPNNGSNGLGSAFYAEPAMLDFENMTWTHSGKRGFNNSESTDLGTINGVAFYMKIESTIGNWGDLAANIPVRCTAYDANDNVAVADITIPFKDNWTAVEVETNQFNIYTANKPRYAGVLNFTPPKEVPTDRLFEWHHVKFITFQIQSFYDKDGRFFPGGESLLNGNFNVFAQSLAGGSISMSIDAFRFVKPLLEQSGTDTTRNMEGEFQQKQYIGNKKQLKSDLLSDADIVNFQHKEFDIITTGRCDIGFGDSFYFRNSQVVNDADNSANTIKLVAKKVEHSITKPAGGSGGFLTKIVGVKRF